MQNARLFDSSLHLSVKSAATEQHLSMMRKMSRITI
jgi:hypothetical protein